MQEDCHFLEASLDIYDLIMLRIHGRFLLDLICRVKKLRSFLLE